jgi:hypothetical protein
MMTFLDLVNAFIREFGVNGGQQISGIAAAGNSAEILKIAAFIADADYEIQSLYGDWRFLYGSYVGSVAAGSVLSQPAFASDFYKFKFIDRQSLVIRPGTATALHPTFMEWRDFKRMWLDGSIMTSNDPSYWSIAPNRLIYINTSLLSATPYQLEGTKMPYRMQSDAHISPIVLWNSSHPLNKIVANANLVNQVTPSYATASATNERDTSGRIIIMRAASIYAMTEGATEVMQGSLAEYQDLLKGLQSSALPGQEDDWSAQSDLDQRIETV